MTNASPLPETGKHTPLPWIILDDHPIKAALHIVNSENRHQEVASLYGGCEGYQDSQGIWRGQHTRQANAELIVTAVNAYPQIEAMRKALGELREVLRSSLTVQTSNTFPPIPDRRFDWCAYFEGREEEGPYGWGNTEAAALRDLFDNYPDDLISRLSQIQEAALIASEHAALQPLKKEAE